MAETRRAVMRILVDANPLFPLSTTLGPTGVGRWTAGTISSLAKAAPEWNIDLVAFHLRRTTVDMSWMGPNVSFRLLRFSNRLSRQMNVLNLFPSIELFLGRADAVVGPAFVTWKARRAAEIPVIHDLTHVHFPRFVSTRNLYYMRLTLPRVLRRAARVVTVSDAMRSEIVATYGLDPEKVAVVPNGVHPDRFHPMRTEGGDGERYLLFVGTLEPRKNLIALLDACDRLRQRGVDVPLVVVAGGVGWRATDLARSLDERQARGEVRVLGYVPEDELPDLYRRAAALVFPSHYEGFGLPVLEAMASGCPVIATDRGGIPEVAGDAAILVSPEPSQIADAIVRVLSDPSLRRRMAEAGLVRARRFSWATSGIAMKEVIEEAVAERVR